MKFDVVMATRVSGLTGLALFFVGFLEDDKEECHSIYFVCLL